MLHLILKEGSRVSNSVTWFEHRTRIPFGLCSATRSYTD